MTNEMQESLPPNPPPPPGEPPGAAYGHWSSDPQWGPPSWPPAPQRGRGGSGLRRTALSVFAIACVGAGGGTAWALTTASISTPSTTSPTGGSTGTGGATNTGGTVPSTGGTLSAATVARLDSAIVDITGDVAGGDRSGNGGDRRIDV